MSNVEHAIGDGQPPSVTAFRRNLYSHQSLLASLTGNVKLRLGWQNSGAKVHCGLFRPLPCREVLRCRKRMSTAFPLCFFNFESTEHLAEGEQMAPSWGLSTPRAPKELLQTKHLNVIWSRNRRPGHGLTPHVACAKLHTFPMDSACALAP